MNKVISKRRSIIISLLFTAFIGLSYYSYSDTLKKETKVIRVVDGDTIVTPPDVSNRLVNVNTFEYGDKEYEKAKSFTKKYLENKTVFIEYLGDDPYERRLVRVYLQDNTYFNLKLVEEGLARKFLVQQSETKLFAKAEKEAIEKERGIWKKSKYYGCLEAKVEAKKEELKLDNNCGSSINMSQWTIMDESRKQYKFETYSLGSSTITVHSEKGKDTERDLYWNLPSPVWNNDRDSAYIFDNDGKIAAYTPYGY